MAKVLGLSFFFHDSAAALVVDGQIVAAGAEERFCRRKHTNDFPKMAIEYCLHAGGLESINAVDAIVFYEKPLLKVFRAIEMMVTTWPRSYETFVKKLPTLLASKVNIAEVIQEHLPGYKGQILFSKHHLSHAASAFYCSPYDRAAILTIDGVGEWETATMGWGEGDRITIERAIHFPHSIGLLYSALTGFLGFKVNDGEWKVMGLAPYGEPRYVDQFRQLVHTRPDGSFGLNMRYFVHNYSAKWTSDNAAWERLFGFPRRDPAVPLEQHHEDLARSGQAVVEELILGLAREARRRYDTDNLVIAGGVGLNCVANWKIQHEGAFENVWIQPAAGDDGGALGAALLASRTVFQDPPSGEMHHAYFGPAYSDDEIREFVDSRGIPYTRVDDEALVAQVADWIAEDKVIGWFRGGMEFGPRALGARSILANPTSADMKATINRKIKFREYFRPFAPAVPQELVHEYFDTAPNSSMPFMLKAPKVKADMQSRIPAVTHEDGTGRVQTVRREDNPVYYDLMMALVPRIGVPVILNTSFNVRGEPIVCSPEDAYNCFLNTEIDALVLGNCLVTQKPDSELDIEALYERSDALERATDASAPTAPSAGSAIVAIEDVRTDEATTVSSQATAQRVLNFYKELPFNHYSNSVDTAVQLMKGNRIKAYPALHRHLKALDAPRVLDVGCGTGWFANSCAHYYHADVIGIEVNPVALKQARSIARLFPGHGSIAFVETDLFEYRPPDGYDVVNSLGVLHHTPDCHGAIRQATQWVKPGGYVHLGLYHLYGRQPFLQHFANMREEGATEVELYEEFAALNPDITDETHMMSWFRDQVLHPHETQHTYEEIAPILEEEGFHIETTSINHDRPNPRYAEIVAREKTLADYSRRALNRKRRYFPGFFTLWARRESR